MLQKSKDKEESKIRNSNIVELEVVQLINLLKMNRLNPLSKRKRKRPSIPLKIMVMECMLISDFWNF
jgi:hypothetical protein